MADNNRIQQEVYISYSRREEERSNIILQLCNTLKNINFKIDTKAVKCRDDFKHFIDEVGCADWVIAVFSEAYMTSYPCMLELTKIIQHGGDFRKRVFPIHDPHYLINENGAKIKAYWEEVLSFKNTPRPDEYTQQGTEEEVKYIYDNLDETIEKIKTISSLTARDLLIENYAPVLDWLNEDKIQPDLDERPLRSDAEYLQGVRAKVLEYINYNIIKTTLQSHLGCDNQDETVLLDKLCTTNSENLIELLDGALSHTVQTLKNESNYANELREKMRELASILSIFVINEAWVRSINITKGVVLEIAARNELASAAASARFYKTYPLYDAKQDSAQISCKGKISPPTKQESWSNKNSRITKGLIAHIWNRVFPAGDSQFKVNDTGHEGRPEFTNDYIKALNNHLIRTKQHFYLDIPSGETYSYLDSNLLHELSRALPTLIVFKVITAGEERWVISNDIELNLAYQRFLVAL